MATDVEPLEKDVVKALDEFTGTLNQNAIPYALIGGLAVLFRSRPRFTQDVDVLMQVPLISLGGLAEELQHRGFTLDTATFIREYVDVGMTGFQYRQVQVDCIKPVVPLYVTVLDTATEVPTEHGQTLRVATAEGLILTKLISFRVQDQQDIYTLMTTHRETLDVHLIRETWQPLADSYPDATKWLDGMLAKFISG